MPCLASGIRVVDHTHVRRVSTLNLPSRSNLLRAFERFPHGPSGRFEPAAGVATLSGVAVETDDATGLALRVAPAAGPSRPRRGSGSDT